MKRCTKCGESKPLSEFYFVASRGYYRANCKTCAIAEVGRSVRHRARELQQLRAERETVRAAVRDLVDALEDEWPGISRRSNRVGARLGMLVDLLGIEQAVAS